MEHNNLGDAVIDAIASSLPPKPRSYEQIKRRVARLTGYEYSDISFRVVLPKLQKAGIVGFINNNCDLRFKYFYLR